MNEEQYQSEKSAIISKFGEPIYDLGEPQNDSAKLLAQLRGRYNASKRKLKSEKKELSEIAKNIESTIQSSCVIELTDSDLVAFDAKERRVLVDYYANLHATASELGKKNGMSRQEVTALLNCDAAQVLRQRKFEQVLKAEVYLGLLASVKRGDTKAILELARALGIIKPETVDINLNQTKPLEDKEALEALRKLGDNIARNS